MAKINKEINIKKAILKVLNDSFEDVIDIIHGLYMLVGNQKEELMIKNLNNLSKDELIALINDEKKVLDKINAQLARITKFVELDRKD